MHPLLSQESSFVHDPCHQHKTIASSGWLLTGKITYMNLWHALFNLFLITHSALLAQG